MRTCQWVVYRLDPYATWDEDFDDTKDIDSLWKEVSCTNEGTSRVRFKSKISKEQYGDIFIVCDEHLPDAEMADKINQCLVESEN